jgi:type II secretion system protein N
MAVDWTVWKPRLAYGAFFVGAFLLALRQTLPADAIRDRLVLEAGQAGWLLEAADVGPAGLVGVGLKEVTLKDKDGLTIPIEALEVSLAPWQLMRGRLRVAVWARIYDGTVKGTFDVTGAPQVLDLAVDKVDLARVIPLRKATGVDLDGLASGSASLTLPADPKAQPSGRFDLVVAGAGLAGGKVAVPGMAGGLTLPKLSLGQLGAKLALEGGKATFERLGSSGGDATLQADGLTVTLQPNARLEFAPVFGQLSLKLEDAFAGKPEGKTLKSLADLALASGKGKDGAYRVQLFGSLGHPQARPMTPTP